MNWAEVVTWTATVAVPTVLVGVAGIAGYLALQDRVQPRVDDWLGHAHAADKHRFIVRSVLTTRALNALPPCPGCGEPWDPYNYDICDSCG